MPMEESNKPVPDPNHPLVAGARNLASNLTGNNVLYLLTPVLTIAVVIVAVIGIVLAVVLTLGDDDAVRSVHSYEFAHITDIHYDPFYNESMRCKYNCRSTTQLGSASSWACGPLQFSSESKNRTAPDGRRGCNSPLKLVRSAFQKVKSVSSASKFILVTGDLASHWLCGDASYQRRCDSIFEDHSYVTKAMSTVTEELARTFNGTPVFPLFGNNDSPVHYVSPLGTTWFSSMGDKWFPLITVSSCLPSTPNCTYSSKISAVNFTNFAAGGYYSVSLADAPVRVIAMNTLLFGPWDKYNLTGVGGAAGQEAAAWKHLQWIESELASVSITYGQKAILAGHIPPGPSPFTDKEMWQVRFQEEFVRIVDRFQFHVGGQVYGHTHMDSWKVGSGPNSYEKQLSSEFSVVETPSVSPVFFNNPAFRRAHLDSRGRLVDHTTYYLDLDELLLGSESDWAVEYNFRSTYFGLSTTHGGLTEVGNRIKTSTPVFQKFLNYRMVSYAPFRMHYVCAMTRMNETEYNECLAENDFTFRDDECLPTR